MLKGSNKQIQVKTDPNNRVKEIFKTKFNPKMLIKKFKFHIAHNMNLINLNNLFKVKTYLLQVASIKIHNRICKIKQANKEINKDNNLMKNYLPQNLCK